jgi:hypothetical protein
VFDKHQRPDWLRAGSRLSLKRAEDIMSASVETYRKGGTHEAVTAAARKLKAFAEKRDAGQLVVNSVIAGSDVGQWAFVITFADWEAFGKSMKRVLPALAPTRLLLHELRNFVRCQFRMCQYIPASTRRYRHMRLTAIALGILEAA